MSNIPDPIREGLARGWRVHGGPFRAIAPTLECDVAIVGSGAGAGITAELLARAGLDVVIVEEGPLKSSRDFNQRESEAYPSLYQESAARKTADKAINILQGRCVGATRLTPRRVALAQHFWFSYSPNHSKRYASRGPFFPSYASCAISSVNGSVYRAIRNGPASTGSNPTSRIKAAAVLLLFASSPQ